MKILHAVRAIFGRNRDDRQTVAGHLNAPFTRLGLVTRLTGNSTHGNTGDGSGLRDYDRKDDTQSP